MVLIECDLGDAVTVSQVDENDRTQVPSLGDPAGKLYVLAFICFSYFSACVISIHNTPPSADRDVRPVLLFSRFPVLWSMYLSM